LSNFTSTSVMDHEWRIRTTRHAQRRRRVGHL